MYVPPSPPPIAVPSVDIFFLPPTSLSLRFSPCPLRAAEARQNPPLPRRLSPHMLFLRRVLYREPTPPRSLIRPRLPLGRLATRHLRLPRRLRAASPLRHADKYPLALALSHLLLIKASGPAGLLAHPPGVLIPRRESHGRDPLWPSLRPLLLPPRLPRRYSCRPVTTAPSLWELLLLRLPPSLDVTSATTADMGAIDAAAELQFGDSAAHYSHTDRARE